MTENHSPLETLIELLILTAVGAQAFLVVNEATDGEAGRKLAWWWRHRIRPHVVRAVTWIDAHAITETMVQSEILPYLEGHQT